MKKSLKALIGIFAITATLMSTTACSNSTTKTSDVDTSSVTEDVTTNDSGSVTDGATPYRVVVDNGEIFKEKSFIERMDNNTIPSDILACSAVVYTKVGFITEEDKINSEKALEELDNLPVSELADPNSEKIQNLEKAVKTGVLIIADDKDNPTAMNNITMNDDYSEATINDGKNTIIVKTGLTYKNEIYMITDNDILEHDVYAFQEIRQVEDKNLIVETETTESTADDNSAEE